MAIGVLALQCLTDGLPKTSCAARSMLGRINATGM